MFCAYTRPRYKVSVYRTIGPLVCIWCEKSNVLVCQGGAGSPSLNDNEKLPFVTFCNIYFICQSVSHCVILQDLAIFGGFYIPI